MNAVTHGIGLALSLVGAVLLIVAAAWSRNAWAIVSCCIYAATLICLYAASTTLHSVSSPRWTRTLETIDHCCIYLLIAGTYMGLLGVIACKTLFASVQVTGLLWLGAGGAAYIGGVGFYVWRRLPFSHAIWHVFVLAGSACHYLAIYYYVVPRRG